MNSVNHRIALILVFVLAFQSFATAGFSVCRHAGKFRNAIHDMTSHKPEMYHQHVSGNAVKPAFHSGCTCDCYCAWGCMHGCQGQALVASIVVIFPDASSDVPAIEVKTALTGFSFPLLRPPSLLNRYCNVIG